MDDRNSSDLNDKEFNKLNRLVNKSKLTYEKDKVKTYQIETRSEAWISGQKIAHKIAELEAKNLENCLMVEKNISDSRKSENNKAQFSQANSDRTVSENSTQEKKDDEIIEDVPGDFKKFSVIF